MNRIFVLISVLLFYVSSAGQVNVSGKKYPSVFWEISGNGLKKPSYLFGTMHVSSKLAFQLSDSFYVAIRSADVVALENNPESWQEDMKEYDMSGYYENASSEQALYSAMPQDYFTIQSLRIGKYEKKLELALFMKPAIINNLLYRSNSEYGSDFEEDTYLDLYIYQTGKRLGKRVAGVEEYAESMRLMGEAYKDAANEKNKKDKSFTYDEEYSMDKLQEAYRSGNLDLLDSINQINSQSAAFDEKFLYQRNEIQASSIDSILKKSSLFVGVGAAHLPGDRGVIEILRTKGYRLRPIFMGKRDSRYKEELEKVRVPVSFATQVSNDGFYKVDIPGKLYQFENGLIDQQQYADMANGSFYMVTRVKTNSQFWGHSVDLIAKKIDSVLYENVPGKILSKTAITKNGYPGFDITNRTRRGDFQRYNIFITPNEVLFFRMGGTGDYVKAGEEGKKFFGSIQLKEQKSEGWNNFQPSYGGFNVDFPHVPYENFSDVVQYNATEKASGTQFFVLRTDIHNYNFAGEDGFDLDMMDESFASSAFIKKRLEKKQLTIKGYPALECRYQHIDGSVIKARYLIQGAHYYSLITISWNENESTFRFFKSFEIIPFVYKDIARYQDSSLHFSVSASWFPAEKKQKKEMIDEYSYVTDDESDFVYFDKNSFKTRLIKNDTTGEAIFVSFYKSPDYFQMKDSSMLEEDTEKYLAGIDSLWIIRSKKSETLKNNTRVFELVASDTSSSRAIRTKTFYKDGIVFVLITQTDTLSAPSSFVSNFFENFLPDSLSGINPFTKKSEIFFSDFFNTDSLIRSKAMGSIGQVELDSSDLPALTKAINSFKWSEKKYLARKISFINKLGTIANNESADLLKQLYYAAEDTVQIQNSVVEALLKQRTQYAYTTFKDIINTEPPVLDISTNSFTINTSFAGFDNNKSYLSAISNGSFFDELYDSLKLTHTILPELLSLLNLDDYKWQVMQLLKTMVDSNIIQANEYESIFSKLYIEARQAVKKQSIAEKRSAIERAEEEKKETKTFSYLNKEDIDKGNESLITYATLLLPFQSNKPGVDVIINDLLSSADRRLKYNTVRLMVQRKKSLPDTLLKYFASLDEYRYELYTDLRENNALEKFPADFKDHLNLARSKLLSSSEYIKPDSLSFLNKLPASYKNKNGFIYFFKYKLKKDDSFWRIGYTGLLPLNVDDILFDEEEDKIKNFENQMLVNAEKYFGVVSDFTSYSEVRLNEDESIPDQLENLLKKLLFEKKKSGILFYTEEPDIYDAMSQRLLGN